MAGMSRISALKAFFNSNTSKPVENTELMGFWKSLSAEEKTEYSDSAAKQLGVEIVATATA